MVNSRVSQEVPVYPGGQEQVCPLTVLVQVPPFVHGRVAHSPVTGIKLVPHYSGNAFIREILHGFEAHGRQVWSMSKKVQEMISIRVLHTISTSIISNFVQSNFKNVPCSAHTNTTYHLSPYQNFSKLSV